MYTHSQKAPDFKYLFDKKIHSDVNIKLDKDVIIKAHKCILYKIHFYQKLFSNDYSEKDISEVEHKDVSETSVNQMLNFLYTGNFVFDNISELIDCYTFCNMISYTEMQDILIDQIDLQNLASKENITNLVKKLLSIKDINEDLILTKIEKIVKLKKNLQREEELQTYCDEKLRFNDVAAITYSCNDFSGSEYNINNNNHAFFCKSVVQITEDKILSKIIINNKIDPTLLRLIKNINVYYIPDKLIHKNRSIDEITNYEYRLVTEKTLYIDYAFMRKYNKNIFVMLQKVYKDTGCKIYVLNESDIDYKIISCDILKKLNKQKLNKIYKF